MLKKNECIRLWTCICDFITDLINSEKIAERNSNQEFAEAWSISGSLGFLLNTVYKPLGRRELTSTQIEEAGRVAAFLNCDSSSVPQITENDLSDYFVASPQVAYSRSHSWHTMGRFSSSGLREARKVRNQWVFKTKPKPYNPTNYQSVGYLYSNKYKFQDNV